MDIFFQDLSEVPLPPEDVRIRELRAEPWLDGRRVGIYLEVTPFQRPPNAEINITNADEEEIAQVSIIETMNPKMEFNMHLRESSPGESYQVRVVLYYQSELPESPESEVAEERPEPMIVDRSQVTFVISKESQ
jgi:hypothetical protein